MMRRLVDTHLGCFDCKLNTIEGSHCSTTENKIYLKCYFILFYFYYYFRFRNVHNCSKIINSLSFYLLRYMYLSKGLHRQKVHSQVASWMLISSKVFIFKINTHNVGRIEPEKKSTAIIIRVKS